MIHQHQRESTDLMRSDSADVKQLLYQILTNQQDMNLIVQMQSEGEHVAERIMEAGQMASNTLVSVTTVN